MALQAPGPGGKLCDRKPAGLIDEKRQMLQLDGDILDLLKVALVNPAAPDSARGNAGLLRYDAGRKLLGGHLEREKSHDAAVDGLDVPISAHLAPPCTPDVVGDVGRKRRFAHSGPTGNDDQIGRLQTTHFAVEIREPGGQARELAIALIGSRGHVDGSGECRLELLEPAPVAASLRELVQPTLGVLDLVARRELHRRVEGDIDHVLADLNELAPDGEIIHSPPVIEGVYDCRRFSRQPGQVLRERQSRDVEVSRQKRFQRNRRGNLAGANQGARNIIDLPVNGLEEMLRLEKIGDAIECLVVDENRTQQRLFRLNVVRSRAVGRRSNNLRKFARGRVDCHDVPVF